MLFCFGISELQTLPSNPTFCRSTPSAPSSTRKKQNRGSESETRKGKVGKNEMKNCNSPCFSGATNERWNEKHYGVRADKINTFSVYSASRTRFTSLSLSLYAENFPFVLKQHTEHSTGMGILCTCRAIYIIVGSRFVSAAQKKNLNSIIHDYVLCTIFALSYALSPIIIIVIIHSNSGRAHSRCVAWAKQSQKRSQQIKKKQQKYR